jgi:crotonobetainyl-CoA:carnitine CoA-transferase CaiB-like acyl-CoA transferase
MCAVLGMPELADDPRFKTNAVRVENRVALRDILFSATGKHPRAWLAAELEKAGVPVGPINDIAGAFADPQIEYRKMRVDLAEDAQDGVTIPGVRTPILMSKTPLRYDRPSPRLGSDDEAVRAALRAGRSAFRTTG